MTGPEKRELEKHMEGDMVCIKVFDLVNYIHFLTEIACCLGPLQLKSLQWTWWNKRQPNQGAFNGGRENCWLHK